MGSDTGGRNVRCSARLAALFGALLLSTAAIAAEDIKRGPPPAWTVAIPLPPASAAASGAFGLRLMDMQTLTDDGTVQNFVRSAGVINSAEALSAAGSLTLVWQPATDTVTVHHLMIQRGDRKIDALANGDFTILRREQGLESATIDGQLTATLQLTDLRVGDGIEFAYTVTNANPILAGHFQNGWGAAGLPIDRLHIRQIWPARQAVRWRVGDGLPKPRITRDGDRRVLTIDATDFKPPILPNGAPGRYFEIGHLQLSDFASWAEVAALMAPLYAKAATLADGSPLKDEIARISAQSPDLKVRAERALALVQSDVRYVADFSGLGGYLPAAADEVWAKRYADCKGKTALLLALLRGLGVEAEAALVSATQSDGVDTSLPMPGRFDHVIVKTVIGGRTYWLDGTRTGDGALDRLATPPFEWALPIAAAGSRLEPLTAALPDKSYEETHITFDASKGVVPPAGVIGEAVLRGDGARGTDQAIAMLPAADRERALRAYWDDEVKGATIDKVDYRFDKETGEARLSFAGTVTIDWGLFGEKAKLRFEPSGSRLGYDIAPERDTGPFADAPVEVGARYETRRVTILLPHDGKGFFLEGNDLEETIAGTRFRRSAVIKGGRFEMTVETRSPAREVTLAAAKAADTATDALFAKALYVRLPHDYRPTAGDSVAMRSSKEKRTGADELLSTFEHLQGGKLDAALASVNAAVVAAPDNAEYLGVRALVHLALKKRAEADADLDKALAIDPRNPRALATRAGLLAEEGRLDDALILLDRVVLVQPSQADGYAMRATLRTQKGDVDAALRDWDNAIRLNPDAPQFRIERVKLLARKREHAKALEDADAYLKLFPEDPTGLALRGNLLAIMGRSDEAKAVLARSVAIEPTTDAYVTRVHHGLSANDAEALADILAVIRLDATRQVPGRALKAALRAPNALEQLLAAYDAAAQAAPSDQEIPVRRFAVLESTDRHDLIEPAYAKLIAADPRDANLLNSRCWYRATHRRDLDGALADCDAAISIERSGPKLDSRGLVHLQRGDAAKAVVDYDAVIKLHADFPTALYGRGIARLRLGDKAGGEADLDAARKLEKDIDQRFAGYGVKP